MKPKVFHGLTILAVLFAAPVAAQDASAESATAAQAAPALAIAPASSNPVLRTGTELPLRLLEQLTTEGKQLRVGNRFRLETAEAVLVNGVTVIPVGSPAVGEITEVRNKGMWGRSGHLAARLLYVTVNGRQIRLDGNFDEKGSAGGVGAVAVSAFVFAPAGFFMTGTSARVPSGTVVRAFIGEDVPLVIPQAAPVVPVVAAPAPVSAPALVPAVVVAPVSAADSGAQARCWRERTC